MSITISETADSGALSAERGEKRYFVTGSDDAGAVRTAVLALAPTSYGGLARMGASVSVIAANENQSTGTMNVRVEYGRGGNGGNNGGYVGASNTGTGASGVARQAQAGIVIVAYQIG